MKENKEKILEEFAEVLKLTRAWHDLKTIEYVKKGEMEYAHIILESGCTYRSNITNDSGMAMIEDIVKTLAAHY